jgi:hypothetical protein
MWLLISLLVGCGEETERASFDNLPPFSPIVDLQPAVPYANDDLEALIVSESIDPDDDSVSLTYAWYKNDELQADLTEATVSADLTSVGDVWTVSIIANDGSLDSADTRRSVTIRNSAPVLTASLQWVDADGNAVADMDAPTQDFDLDASMGYDLQVVATTEDIDEDEITYTYVWSVDGVEINLEEALLTNDQLSNGQEWMVEVTANDGLVDSDSVEIAFDFFNAAPVITAVSMNPEMPYLGDSVLCEATLEEDAEGDTVETTFVWTITAGEPDVDGDGNTVVDENGNPVYTVSESSDNPLDTSAFAEGDSIQCRATADDGHDTSSMATDTIVLTEYSNTAPTVTDVTITGEFVGETLMCSAMVSDAESAEEDLTVSYEWTDASGTSLGMTDSLDTTSIAPGDITCTVTADDGEMTGSASATVSLQGN